MKKIILASKSVDRSEILKSIKVPFEVYATNVDENTFKIKSYNPIDLAKEVARAKAIYAKKILCKKYRDAIIIAADTIVEIDGEVIGKAMNEQEAFQILKRLAGNTHNLITGISITGTNDPKLIVDHDVTSVKFLSLSDAEIWAYIKANEWKGRAGAYSIREKASLFIEFINGSPSNVVGLPMQKIFSILKNDFNLNLMHLD